MCDSDLRTARVVVGVQRICLLGLIGCAGIPELS